MVNERVQNAVLGCNLKNDRMISVCLQGKPFNITVFQVYALTSNAKETEVERFYGDLQDLLELIPPPPTAKRKGNKFALEMNRDHSVTFEIASKYCISDSFVDHDGYSISSKGFLPSVVDIMVI